MINLSVPIVAFALALLVGAWLDSRLHGRAGTGKRRRVLQASLPLPLLVLLLSAAGMLWEVLRTRTGENMADLAIAVYAAIGALFGAVTFAGGVVGAFIAERKFGQ